jgi:hypothetical protein
MLRQIAAAFTDDKNKDLLQWIDNVELELSEEFKSQKPPTQTDGSHEEHVKKCENNLEQSKRTLEFTKLQLAILESEELLANYIQSNPIGPERTITNYTRRVELATRHVEMDSMRLKEAKLIGELEAFQSQ